MPRFLVRILSDGARALVLATALLHATGSIAVAQAASPQKGIPPPRLPVFAGELTGAASAPAQPLSLWYRRPAEKWVEALPIGNGRLAAMVFGGIVEEHLQLNEDTLWAGGPYDPNNPDAVAALPEVRRLIFEGKYTDAHKLIAAKMMAKPIRQMMYQPVGDLVLKLPEAQKVENYRRDLDLDSAVAGVSYEAGGVHFTREVFASPVDQVIAIHLTADKPRQISFTARIQTPQQATTTVSSGDTLVLFGENGAARGIPGALKFRARVRVIAQGGRVQSGPDSITVDGANSATLLIAIATSYRKYNDVSGDPEALASNTIAAAAKKSYDKLRAAHIAEHQRLFRRVHFDLGTTAAAQRPTDERIQNFAGGNDPQLAALYFQFGRYLLISSSRPGSQPANLQGKWNDSMTPPWDSKYTININTEMNYWPAETTNLSELVEPLTAMVMDLTQTGEKTAEVEYGARGWVVHHNTDLWRATAPVDSPQSGIWPTGGAWLCENLWEHYLFTGDRKFLARLYPALKGASQFFLDTLVDEPKHHWLVTSPSVSPENRHPFGTSVVDGPTMDEQILRDLFGHTMEAAETLGIDPALRAQIAAARARLAPNQIGHEGQLQEWLEDWDMQAPDLHHRHVSHLYGFFPSAQITLRGDPKLAAAVRKSLEVRGDMATGWAIAWRLNLWARLQDAEHAYKILALLISPERTYPNMFDAHPPFQIDGNFGGTSGMTEMLLQSHAGEIELLPALPREWPGGHVSGLRARGGFEIEISWSSGNMTTATIHSVGGTKATLRYGAVTRQITMKPGGAFTWDGR
jgi:alpha-L-fucosidase 2